VKFGGTDANDFVVNDDNSISAQVAMGTTGTISVITPEGTATSSGTFTYLPSFLTNMANEIFGSAIVATDEYYGQAFTTGSSTYNLTSVDLSITLDGDDAVVKIYSSGVGGILGSEIAALGGTYVSGSVYNFSPSTPIPLMGNTTYWLVLYSTNSTYCDYTDDVSFSGTGGTTIPETNRVAYSNDAGTNWVYYSASDPDPDYSEPFMFALYGNIVTDLTWTGTNTTDWNTTGNWSTNTIPLITDDVTIPNVANDPVIASGIGASCNNLTVNSGASLTVNSGGSLITNGTITNNGTITMHKALSGSNAWQMISGPAEADISDNGLNPAVGNDDFYAWHEAPPGTWVNYHNTSGDLNFPTVNGGDNFVSGKGYLVSYQDATVNKSITGTPNTGNQSFMLENANGAKAWEYTAGWNLLGNPYPSYIDWNLVDHDVETSKFQDVYAYWYNPNKEGGANYEYINGSSEKAYIAPFQGFFVLAKTESDDQNFTFTNAMRRHFESGFGKTNDNEGLCLRLGNETFYDETSIIQQNESQHSRDRLDALKMYSFNPEVPQLYSLSADDVPLAINSIPTAETGSPVALGALLPAEGDYTISLLQNDESLTASGLFLEDRLLGVFHKLSEQPYDFTASAGEIIDRFYIHFGMVDLPENSFASNVLIWQQGELLLVSGTDDFTDLQLFDVHGKLLGHKKLYPASQHQLAAPKTAGVYVVRLFNAKQMITQKVIVY